MKVGAEIKEGIRISIDAIRGNLLRSGLTTIGIVIGVVTVTLMATAIEGLNNSFRDAISFMGTDVLYIARREWFIDSDEKWIAQSKRKKITLSEARALERSIGMVHGVAPSAVPAMTSHGCHSFRLGFCAWKVHEPQSRRAWGAWGVRRTFPEHGRGAKVEIAMPTS